MSNNKFTFLVAVHAFFINKRSQVLLLQRANTGYMDGYFSVPAGHVDGGESISTAMRREILEEVGIKTAADLSPSMVMHRLVSATEERIDYFFIVREWSGEPQNCETHKCSGLEWHPLQELPENTIPYIRFGLNRALTGDSFCEFDERGLR